jgi:hypothetical protein
MKKIRCSLVAVALLAALGGLTRPGIGLSLTASTTSGLYTNVSSVARVLSEPTSARFKLAVICPGGGSDDC